MGLKLPGPPASVPVKVQRDCGTSPQAAAIITTAVK